jgi:putative hydrolase of the HAD superfamily
VRGLLLDFGGVLTTNVFDAFRAYCRAEGLPENAIKDLFRMRAAVRAARAAGVRTGVISNSWGSALYGAADFDGLVDDVVISGEVGLHMIIETNAVCIQV